MLYNIHIGTGRWPREALNVFLPKPLLSNLGMVFQVIVLLENNSFLPSPPQFHVLQSAEVILIEDFNIL
jgi:hypothetical protein